MSANDRASVRTVLLHTRMGGAGIVILGVLVALSIFAISTGFSEHVREWNDPAAWLLFPKSAIPMWANFDGFAEHKVLQNFNQENIALEGISRSSVLHAFELDEGRLPTDMIYEYTAHYTGAPLLELEMFLANGRSVKLASVALPHSEEAYEYHGRIFSADSTVRKLVAMQFDDIQSVESAIFGDTKTDAYAGTYTLVASLYDVNGTLSELTDSTLIIGGGAYGVMGTDEMRRDIIVGLLLGTPLALFVGLTVAVASVMLGLAYGMYAGYKGGRKDEAMMRLNDIVYALPALPFLIILAVTINSSIFVIVAFLILFGWVGVAKVSRSMSLQARARGYVEASKMMGQRDSKTIIMHIMPQLLPYALASIAISVPAAITTEAGLSFLGLGDPEYPTWGSMLQDASRNGAAARGLWWWVIPPGLMIAVTGMAFVFIGGAFDFAVNPRLRHARLASK